MNDEAEKSETWTPPRLVNSICDIFKRRGLPPPHRLEAEYLVCEALNISRLQIYLQHDKPCNEKEQKQLRELVKRRLKREPLAYILKNCKFWTLDLAVGPGALIPRQDTETLVETALKCIQIRQSQNLSFILEFGTGCGAIALALATECRNVALVAVDCSGEALRYANQNLLRYQNEIMENGNCLFLIHCDRFDAISKRLCFDMIISNPPYIASEDISELQPEINGWEPTEALDGGIEGLDFYTFLRNSAVERLKDEGYLVMEHGYDQKSIIQDLIKESASLELISSVKDHANHNRVLVYQKNATKFDATN